MRSKYKVQPDESGIPDIVPGIIPLWQILEWFETGVLDDEFPVEIYMNGKQYDYTLDELNPYGRGIIIDCIRVFGLDTVRDLVLIM